MSQNPRLLNFNGIFLTGISVQRMEGRSGAYAENRKGIKQGVYILIGYQQIIETC